MEKIEQLFDTYSLNARVKPAFFIVFPVVLSILAWIEASRTMGGFITTFIVTFGIITFAANQMSTRGNILQEKLFIKWGGAPTTIILRHSDSRLDKYTKERYMQKLTELIPNFLPISNEQEQNNQNDADEMYRTATNFLKERTRDVKIYPLVFKELILYGFSRNIRAFKLFGVITTLLTLVINTYVIWFNYFKGVELAIDEIIPSIPFLYIGLILILLLVLFIWLFIITEKWVEIRAFAYAKALYAACEKEI